MTESVMARLGTRRNRSGLLTTAAGDLRRSAENHPHAWGHVEGSVVGGRCGRRSSCDNELNAVLDWEMLTPGRDEVDLVMK